MSTEPKFTPGPWVACENDPDGMDYDKLWITTDDRLYKSLVPIAEVGIDYSEPMNSEQVANAHLISAAPEMFHALADLLERYRIMGFGEGPEAIAAKLALSKANPSEVGHSNLQGATT